MGRGNRPYTMDDYIKDREQAWGKNASTVLQNPNANGGTKQFTVSRYTPTASVSLTREANRRRNNEAAVATPTVETPAVEAPSVSAGDTGAEGTAGAVPLTDVDLYKFQMEQARQKVYEVLNRKFKYNAKESPLYTIMQQQYEREAERAAGRAYASAVANTGGYGSSYATLSAEEARRQVMAGMDDAQLELYQAARQEFLDERESAVEWYNQARQMYLDGLEDEEREALLAEEAASGMNDATYQLLLEASTGGWYDGKNGNLLRAKLETYKAGNTSIDVDAIMAQLEREYEAGLADTEAASEADVADSENVQAYYDAAAETWDGTNEAQVRAGLKNDGATDKEIDAVVAKLRADTQAVYTDDMKKFEINPTLSGAQDILDDAKLTGDYDAYSGAVSATLTESITKAMDDPSTGYKVLGVDQEAWDGMSDDEKDAVLLDEAGKALKAGTITAADYESIVVKNAKNSLAAIGKTTQIPLNKAKDVLHTVSGVLMLRDQGLINTDMARSIIDEVAKTEMGLYAYDNLQESSLEIGGEEIDRYKNLTDEEEESLRELGMAMYRTGVKKNASADAVFNTVTNRFNTGNSDNPASKKKKK